MKEDFSSGVMIVLPVLEPPFPNCSILLGVTVDTSLSEEKSKKHRKWDVILLELVITNHI